MYYKRSIDLTLNEKEKASNTMLWKKGGKTNLKARLGEGVRRCARTGLSRLSLRGS